jgi:hypothetical protein
MCVLIQTQPKSSALLIRIARPKSLVHTAGREAVAHAVGPGQRLASSLKRWTVMTGPKISFWLASSSCSSPSITVGSTKNPRVADRRPRR